ncbi:hypothetical protein FT663_00525 [Candidozyma haemuli var. vulneris]|uniref:Carbohydrate kinase PfkB domain-containing protein n=1 Tax=Candidozyma haemuli TaxID=45357 RepID=A0A2V1B1G3_9ASCO|nr:hypothetical protein CXQ85_003999 [[Candida] haemuloni]KAF3993251.1 hypothetical protein FT662_00631 [[Candida] haemuloni var. vulneris]KAF3995307.1 hypothetical protein FT663_00525 [[Candida] haemuloni var. vulneris]PVH23706.1 hypothetical protein CXQ85_003999 [[Candida] haemuloni]
MTSPDPILTTLGLFIIDDNIYPESWKRETEYNIIGGGASYAIVGGRIASGPSLGKRITGIIDKGTDFPQEVEYEINSWGAGPIFRENPDRLTTRGANVYQENGFRSFAYRSPKKRIEDYDIVNTENLIRSKAFHTCCAIDRCGTIIDCFAEQLKGTDGELPIHIFEPFPDICIPQNYEPLKQLLPKLHIFSPNLEEAAGFLGLDIPSTENGIAKLAEQFIQYSPKDGGVVIRCGAKGCYIKTHSAGFMLEAYHDDQSKVVDVTGGGNTFCGAFATAFYLSKQDWLVAGIFGNVASGCIVEKLGMPAREPDTEIWNGTSIKDRLHHYTDKHSLKLDLERIDWI